MPFPQNVTETVYNSLVHDYCDVAWSTGADKLVEKYKKLQKFAARILLGPQEQLNFTKS